MSIHAKLYIDEVEYTVLKFDFDFQKAADVNGRPTTKYTGGLFNFSIESTNKTDILLWSVNPTEMKEVKLVISPNHNTGKSRTIILGDALCLSFTNEYFSVDNQPLKEYFTVSPGYMMQGGQIIFEKNWKRTDLSIANVEPTRITQVDEEQKIIRQYITDRNDVELEEYNLGDKIYYVIESQNMNGESIDLNLNDKTIDFLYKEERLKDDKLENYIIASEQDKIALEVIAEDYKDE